MKTREQIVELCKKLYALATRGEGGEATNAKAQLDAVLRKWNISMHEIEETEMLEERAIDIPARGEGRSLIQHLVSSLLTEGVSGWAYSRDKKRMYVAMTNKNYQLFLQSLPIYQQGLRKHMSRQRKIALTAFMQKHDLYSKFGESEKMPTPEEMLIIYEAMRQSVEHIPVNPALTSG